jgi:hypothetical protein
MTALRHLTTLWRLDFVFDGELFGPAKGIMAGMPGPEIPSFKPA